MKKDPETETGLVPKQVKNTAINWLVSGALAIIFLGCLALGRAQVAGMLQDYQTKKEAGEVNLRMDAQISSLRQSVQDLQSSLNTLDRKLDHLQYTVEYSQSQARAGGSASSPKMKDAP